MKRIVETFEKGKSIRKIVGVKYDDGSTGELFSYYPNDVARKGINFNDFIGLTRSEAMSLYKDKYE